LWKKEKGKFMKNVNKWLKGILSYGFVAVVALVAMSFAGCNEDPDKSLYDALGGVSNGATPVITSISPAVGALAGVDEIVITGQNFSATPTDNKVQFDNAFGTIVSATSTSLTVKTIRVPSDSSTVKVSVKGAPSFSNSVRYRMIAAVGTPVKFGEKDQGVVEKADPVCTEFDRDGNMFVMVKSATEGNVVMKFTKTGQDQYTYTSKATATLSSPATTQLVNMRFGWGGDLYAVNGSNRAVLVLGAKGTSALASFTTSLAGMTSARDLDFDRFENLWVIGNSTVIFRVRKDKTTKSYAFNANLYGAHVYNDYLYVVGSQTVATVVTQKIWRFKIDATTQDLGAAEEVFNITSNLPATGTANSLTIAEDGEIILSATIPSADVDGVASALYRISGGAANKVYDGTLDKISAINLTWSQGGTKAYYVREIKTQASGETVKVIAPQTVVWVELRKSGSTYHGRTIN